MYFYTKYYWRNNQFRCPTSYNDERVILYTRMKWERGIEREGIEVFFGNLGRTLGPWKYERAVVLVLSLRADRQLIFIFYCIYMYMYIFYHFTGILFKLKNDFWCILLFNNGQFNGNNHIYEVYIKHYLRLICSFILSLILT